MVVVTYYESGTIRVFHGTVILEIDPETGKIVDKHPEKGDIEEWPRRAAVAVASATLLENMQGLTGIEQARIETAKLLVSTVEAMTAAATREPGLR